MYNISFSAAHTFNYILAYIPGVSALPLPSGSLFLFQKNLKAANEFTKTHGTCCKPDELKTADCCMINPCMAIGYPACFEQVETQPLVLGALIFSRQDRLITPPKLTISCHLMYTASAEISSDQCTTRQKVSVVC